MSRFKKPKGFSLLEVVIYFGLLVLLLVILTDLLTNVSKLARQLALERDVNRSVQLTATKISEEVKEAKYVLFPILTGVPADQLFVRTGGATPVDTRIEYDPAEKAIYIDDAFGRRKLTENTIEVQSFEIVKLTKFNISFRINARYRQVAGGKPSPSSFDYRSAVSLRETAY